MKNSLFLILIMCLCIHQTLGQTTESDTTFVKDTLIVGYKISPPFTMEDEAGNCIGISAALWKNIAANLDLKFVYKKIPFNELLNAINRGRVDICISPLTVTSDRLKKFDFTQPFYTSNLAIASKREEKSKLEKFVTNFFSVNFFKAVLLLFSVILLFGFLIWLTERHHGNDQFARNVKGIGHGIWWSAVTMTTVGYGDKIPKSVVGRLLGVIWMFTSIIVISSFTGSIAASLSAQTTKNDITKIDDLKSVRTATIRGSNSADLLLNSNIAFSPLDTIQNGLMLIKDGKLDAFLYDEPIIRYLVKTNDLNPYIQISTQNSNSQYYSFSLPHHHPLYDRINITLIKELENVKWKEILNDHYLSN